MLQKREITLITGNWEILRFSAASSKFLSQRQILQRGVKIRVQQNTAGSTNKGMPSCYNKER